ncbi:MAG TPA: tRNA-dihydrouridine synthase, partial [Candidatus Hodarchaeales archaeon]|nr:tRNA-dihydrouridine synthase [Candidatus Hodarchaeales archaeon]
LISDLIHSSLHDLDNLPVFINVRFARVKSLEPLLDAIREYSTAIIEINAHCRQPEITALGAGQALLGRPERVLEAIELVQSTGRAVAVKVRGNDSKMQLLMEAFGQTSPDYLHVDAYEQNSGFTDLNLLRNIRLSYSGFLIGNNSVRDTESAYKALSQTGIDAVSIARGARENPGIFAQITQELSELGYKWRYH